jgi:hypothetical protein
MKTAARKTGGSGLQLSWQPKLTGHTKQREPTRRRNRNHKTYHKTYPNTQSAPQQRREKPYHNGQPGVSLQHLTTTQLRLIRLIPTLIVSMKTVARKTGGSGPQQSWQPKLTGQPSSENKQDEEITTIRLIPTLNSPAV